MEYCEYCVWWLDESNDCSAKGVMGVYVYYCMNNKGIRILSIDDKEYGKTVISSVKWISQALAGEEKGG